MRRFPILPECMMYGLEIKCFKFTFATLNPIPVRLRQPFLKSSNVI